MADEEKASGPLAWIKTAKDKIRAFANRSEPQRPERPRVGLALAGGFARGIAHIGVLRVLREAGIPIDCVAGTSVGALIGAAFCGGASLEEMEKIGAVTVYYSHGDIIPPLRASCAYPGLFVPIQYENRTLVDGFLTAPVPIEGVLLLGADIVVAVYLESGNIEQPRTLTDILSRSFNIMQRHADFAWRAQADITIEPDVKQFVWDDFTRTPDMVAAGEVAALHALPQIRAALRGEKRDSAAGGNLSAAISK